MTLDAAQPTPQDAPEADKPAAAAQAAAPPAQDAAQDAAQPAPKAAAAPSPTPARHRDAVRPGVVLPHVSVHCFPVNETRRTPFDAFAADRRMARTTVEVIPGGLQAAARRYADASTPNLLIVESTDGAETLLAELDALAELCQPETQVVVVGAVNDIALYRALTERGVADYLLAPARPLSLVEVGARLFCPDDTPNRIGRVISFIGSKGGVGSSVIAQNVAWRLSEHSGADVLLLDMDFAFGASAISCNVEAQRGMGDAMREVARLDGALLERLMTRRGKHMCLLAAPASLDYDEEPADTDIEKLIDVARRNVPTVILDLPHHWNHWVRAALLHSDAVAVVTSAGLAAMRNASLVVEQLRSLRPNDTPPRIVLNQVGVHKRNELDQKDVKATLNLTPDYSFDFDPKLFGAADAKGLMITETPGGKRLCAAFDALAADLTGRAPAVVDRGWSLRRLFGR